MSRCSKRRSDNEKAAIQKQSVITSQETRDSNKNSEEKRDEKDTKEID